MKTSDHLHYMPQLDGLRAVAVFSVMIAHFPTPWWIKGLVPWGVMGVHLFFVLSGFLITRILLRCRLKIESGSMKASTGIGHFYARRFLRIFPAYYACLIIFFFLDIAPIKNAIGWHVTYLSNVYFSLRGEFWVPAGHLWSLSVEEQFYILWPAFILFLPKRFLLPFIMICIVIAPIFRIGIGYYGFTLNLFTPSFLDALAGGSLLAWFWESGVSPERTRHLFAKFCLWLGAPFFVVLNVLHKTDVLAYSILSQTIQVFVMNICFIWVVHRTSIGFKGNVGRILNGVAIRYLGKISYGMYIYHNFTRIYAPIVLGQLGITEAWWMLECTLCILLTIAAASLSWHVLEYPLNSLKRYFRYAERSDNSSDV